MAKDTTHEPSKRKLRMFSKALAVDIQKKLKARKPDITAAFVLMTIYTWQNSRNNKFERFGNKAAFQSCEGLQADLPWLNRATILRAIKRLEKAFGTMFTVYRDSTREMNFAISPTLIKQHFTGKKANLSLWADDAEKFGIVKAVLIRNLEYKTEPDHVTNPLRDDQGRIYGAMSASTLTKLQEGNSLDDGFEEPAMLPFSRKEVQVAISELKTAGVFLEHADKRGFYASMRQANESAKEDVSMLPNATVVLPNATVLLPNAPVSQDKIEYIDGNFEFESVLLKSSHRLRLPEAFDLQNPDKSETNEMNDIEYDDWINGRFIGQGKPKSLADVYPGLDLEIQNRSEHYKQLRADGKLIQIVRPGYLPYDEIYNPFKALWEESELPINPLTNKPINLANFDDQIDLALHFLDDELTETFGRVTNIELGQFRQVFRDHHDLTVPMVQAMLERVRSIHDPVIGSSDGKLDEWDDEFYAKNMNSLQRFTRYFSKLFAETFIPIVRDYYKGEWKIQFVGSKPIRDWSNVDKEYIKLFQDADGKLMNDVVFSVCKRAIEEEDCRELANDEGVDSQ